MIRSSIEGEMVTAIYDVFAAASQAAARFRLAESNFSRYRRGGGFRLLHLRPVHVGQLGGLHLRGTRGALTESAAGGTTARSAKKKTSVSRTARRIALVISGAVLSVS
jgi:hypothetical protein